MSANLHVYWLALLAGIPTYGALGLVLLLTVVLGLVICCWGRHR